MLIELWVRGLWCTKPFHSRTQVLFDSHVVCGDFNTVRRLLGKNVVLAVCRNFLACCRVEGC